MEAEVVDISEISDPPVVVTLEDGTKLRVKTDVIEVVRVEGQWDGDGHPIYHLRSGTFIAVLESPDRLKKGGGK